MTDAHGSTDGMVLLVGATSAIMRALAHELAADGHALLLTARDGEELQAIAADLRIRHDVEVEIRTLDVQGLIGDPEPLADLLDLAGDRLAGAVLGVGYLGEQDEAQRDWSEARRVLEVNFVGAVAALEPIARHLSELGRGFIAVFSSVAGDRGRQSNYLYGSAKAGLSAYLSGLRNRLHPAGIAVVTVLPGFVDTQMTYGKPGLFLVASPGEIARGVHKAIRKRADVVYLPRFWRWIMLIIRTIPEPLFKRLKL
ncbi:MAG: SDR family oxidoreductase [Gemmatimonadota bacterium]